MIEALKNKCIADNIPIIRDKTAKFIRNTIESKEFKKILEIGTAYGYSAELFSSTMPVERVVSIEKNPENYAIAHSFLKDNSKIKLINADAFALKLNEKFDMIFIDGPKSHQEILLDKYSQLLNKGGIIFIDNMFLKKFETK
jgi:predicted O-methyltransferase YrrM